MVEIGKQHLAQNQIDRPVWRRLNQHSKILDRMKILDRIKRAPHGTTTLRAARIRLGCCMTRATLTCTRTILGLIAGAVATAAVNAQPAGSSVPHFAVSPTSGRAPLSVVFCASAGITIDFGDGTTSWMDKAPPSACPAGDGSYVTHTYTAAGTYQLRGFPCPSSHDALCGGVAQQASAVKITVLP
jgi:hypothetical protein